MSTACRAALALTLTATGCDDSAKHAREAQAAAEAEKAAEAEERKKALAERKAEREAEFKKKQEAKEKLAAELERLCVLPEKMPKRPPDCQAVGEAHDAFVRRVANPDEIAAWDGGGKEKTIPMTVVQCTQARSAKVAVCQKHALDEAGAGLKDHTDELLQTCIDEYGKTGGTPPAAVPKRRPG